MEGGWIAERIRNRDRGLWEFSGFTIVFIIRNCLYFLAKIILILCALILYTMYSGAQSF